MKRLISIVLIFTMALALAAPMAAGAPNGFITGVATQIVKNDYDHFTGIEITSNNSVTKFDGFNFVADNKTYYAWYIDVIGDLKGTLESAYKSGPDYYNVVFEINGAGRYWIGDSKGGNSVNMVKIGAFQPHVHVYTAVVTPPGCKEENFGYTTYTCVCGDSYIGDIVPGLPHDAPYPTITREPTCTEPGQTIWYCLRCGEPDTIMNDQPPALGHDWDDGVVALPATCENDGVMLFTCKRDGCGETYTEAIPAIGHDYHAKPYTHGDAYVWYECANCGDSYSLETEKKIGWITMYSNADGVNAAGTYYKQTDIAGVWQVVKNYAGGTHFFAPTDYDPVSGFTGSVEAQFIWDKPQADIAENDIATIEFSYQLPDALSRKIIDYAFNSGGGVGFVFYYAVDGELIYSLNDHPQNSSRLSEDELVRLGAHHASGEGDLLKALVANPDCDAITYKFEARNTSEYGSKSGQAMVMFAGAIAYEYYVLK